MSIAFSVDLEPNKDGTFDGVGEAMSWVDVTVPQATIYATHRAATNRPEILKSLVADHEIGVHVHPREFGYEADDLARLPRQRQRELIGKTRQTVASAAGLNPGDLTAFRAGRHKAGPETLAVLSDMGFEIDASVNVRYREHMPANFVDRPTPFIHDSGLVELPTTYGEPSLLSRVGLRAGLGGNITATAHELRADRRFCSGLRALSWLFGATDGVVSMYMHPYDATSHEGLENDGPEFRRRIKKLLNDIDPSFVTANDVLRRFK
jgi:hypothetical protein